ncbi:MAG: mechanosensitive ion channel, partial [Gammaproteobacteria bacterium]|nr:mechanosensitive ion channel [Gammaproteobacteria bacterium]
MLFRLPILILLFLFLSFPSYAANSTPTLKNNNLASNLTQDQPFDPDAANQTLDRINETKLLEEANTGALQQLISTINNLKLRAKQCIDDSNEGLGKLSKISPPTTQTEPQADISLADQQYIEQKQQGLKDEAAKCRLFIIRADEITADLSINLQKLLKNELLYSEAAVPQNFAALYNSIQTLPQAFNKQNFVTNSGIALFDSAKIIMLSLMLVFSITIGFWLKHLLLQYMGEKTETRYSYQIKQAFFSVSRKYIVLFAPITTFAICMSMLNYGIKEHTYLTLSSYGLLLYIVFLASIRFFFYPPKPAVTALSEIPHHLAKSLFRRASVFATICLIIFIGYLFL